MKKTKIIAGVVMLAVCSALTASAALAQSTVDVAKITCGQFIHDDIALSKSIAVWLAGYYSGQERDTMVDLGRLAQDIDKVQDFCRLNMEVPVMQAAQKVLSASK